MGLQHVYREVKRGLRDAVTGHVQHTVPPQYPRERHSNSKQGVAAAKKGKGGNCVRITREETLKAVLSNNETPHSLDSQ